MSCVRTLIACCLHVLFVPLVLSVPFVGAAIAADPVLMSGADLAASHRAAREAEQKLLQALHKKIKVNWPNVPVTFPLKLIAREAGVPLWIDQDAIAADGLDLESRVTLKRGESTMWQALHFLLTPLGLTWEATDGVLIVLPTTKAQQRLITRTYDISAIATALDLQLEGQARGKFPSRDLRRRGGPEPRQNGLGFGAVEVEEFPFARAHAVGAGDVSPPASVDGIPFFLAQQPAFGAGDVSPPVNVDRLPFVVAQFGGGGIGIPQPPPNPPVPEIRPSKIPRIVEPEQGRKFGWRIGESRSRAETAILELLRKGPWPWADADDEGGSMAAVSGRLIVRHNYQTQLQIQFLLDALDTIFVRGANVKSLPVRRPGYPHDEDANILQRLNAPTSIDVVDEPLMDVLQSLAQPAGIRHWLDVRALTEDGVTEDQQVTLTLTEVPLSVILKHSLEPLGLAAVIEEGTLVVTTQAKANERDSLSTVIYSLADFAGHSPEEIVSVLENGLGQQWIDVFGCDGGMHDLLGSQWLVVRQSAGAHAEIANFLEKLRRLPKLEPLAPKPERRIYPVADATAVADLVRTLPELVPNWDGQRGSIHRLGQSLVIQQLPIIHERVEEIIAALNAAHASLDPAVPVAIPVKPDEQRLP